jgi:hypothetical protein
MLGKLNMRDDQHEFVALLGQPAAHLTVEQAASPTRRRPSPGAAKEDAAIVPGWFLRNGGMADLTENASGERAFMDEKELLTKLPISRRTLGTWKATGVLPYIKIGRRCLYDWASVQGALLRRQRGGQCA